MANMFGLVKLVGNQGCHLHTDMAWVDGYSVAPIPDVIWRQFAPRAGASARRVEAAEVQGHFLGIIRDAESIIRGHVEKVVCYIEHGRRSVEEASRLAKTPTGTDEVEIIAGLIRLADNALAVPTPPTETADHLRRVLPAVEGLDVDALKAAFGNLDAIISQADEARARLTEIRAELQAHHAIVSDPDTIAAVMAKKCSIKASRAIGPALDELRALRATVAATLEGLDAAIGRLASAT
ncbi:MAG TPA: hypothetical protein VK196_05245 [Magnetospirillum sp.]|nr:hypothetical protein [Magnetospirillum sp.]